jgi:hypothetical protein
MRRWQEAQTSVPQIVSFQLAFYAGRLVLDPKLQNPTIVLITDRNDLDDQLYGTFSRCHELLRQAPVQALDREWQPRPCFRRKYYPVRTSLSKQYVGWVNSS